MSLGPSLKVNTIKPVVLQVSAEHSGPLMPPDIALIPTGNAWISEYLPGFNVMRASYRWSALGIFAAWLLLVCRVARLDDKSTRRWVPALVFIILFNLPNPGRRWEEGVDNRAMFQQIDRDVVAPLRQQIQAKSTVAFVPWSNDFLANYLAPRTGFRTFNIGGDKNVALAQAFWPVDMRALGNLDTNLAPKALKMLTDGNADILVLPYFNMLWSAHLWPCADLSTARLIDERSKYYRSLPGFTCPSERRIELKPMLSILRAAPYVEVTDTGLYATVKLRREFAGQAGRLALLESLYGKIEFPLIIGKELTKQTYFLKSGWHEVEASLVWSGANAVISLPISERCSQRACTAVMKFQVFGASLARPVAVSFVSRVGESNWSKKTVVTSTESVQVQIPLTGKTATLQDIAIAVPDAVSPLTLSGAKDDRVLGIALQRIDLLND